MYRRASSARYANYETASLVTKASNGLMDEKAMASRHPPPLMANGHVPGRPASSSITSSSSAAVRERLQRINSSMWWIREELEDLKESDRVLMDIFKQLEGDVAELTDNISTWRMSGSYGRPISTLSEADESLETSHPPTSVYQFDSSTGQSSLESTLTSSKEEDSSGQTGSDSLLATEVESTSNSCSPVLLPQATTNGLTRSPVSSSQKRQTSASPQLKGSASMNRIANSPSISRLQDETSSNISRNSSIDSGIQFASEAENSSANGVEAAVSPSTEPSPPTLQGMTSLPSTNAQSNSDEGGDSSLVDEVFSMLGLKL